jgi:hypothetical protein
MFLDDPSELIAPMEAVWPEYIARGEELEHNAEQSVVEWRSADDESFVPDHPFYRTLNTGEANGYIWLPRALRWVETVRNEVARVQHGFDSEGRLVIAKRGLFRRVLVYGHGFYDLLFTYPDEETGGRMTAEKERGGIRRGGFTRFHVDGQGRIMSKVRLSNEGPEPDSHYRLTEVFTWKDGRVADSFRQSFDLGDEIPSWAKKRTPEQQAAMYRRVNDRLREYLPGRNQVRYEYGSDGGLVKADLFDGEAGKHRATLYTRDPDDTIENISDELAAALGKALVKAVKPMKAAYPLRRVALIYSAEHAHCGLPTRVLIQQADGSERDPLNWEAYPHEAVWPPEGRTGQKIESLQRRLLVVVEGAAAYAHAEAPQPYRELLWRASRDVYDALVGKKRIVSEDFAVFPLDDHGDVDASEDVRQSLPPEASERVLRDSQSGRSGAPA